MIAGSVLEMPFDDGTFDLAVSLDVIEHLEDDVDGAARAAPRPSRPAAPCSSPSPPTSGCGAATTRSTTTTAATRANPWSAQHSRPAGGRSRTTYFNALLLPAAILLRVLDRLSTKKTTESSLDLWVPPAPLNWLLERPLVLEGALIARGGRIPAGLSLLAVFR